MKLRVAHCIYDDPENPWVGGGAAVRVRELYQRLTDDIDATILTGHFPGASDADRDGVRYLRCGNGSGYLRSRLTFGRAARRRLGGVDSDLVVFDFSPYTTFGLPQDRPHAMVVHMLMGPAASARWGRLGGALVRRWEAARLKQARWISPTSNWLRGELESLARPDATCRVVGSGVDDAYFAIERRERDHLLYYGRFDIFQKGLDVLIDAFARVASARPNLRLVLAGRGKDEQSLPLLIRHAGLDGRVEVVGGVTAEQRADLFAGALAMVSPSRQEGLPMAPAEAMAAGVPVVACEVGAMAEVVGSGGVVVPADDVAALAAAMSELVDDDAKRHALSDAARTSAQRFRWDAAAAAHLAFLREAHEAQR